MTDDEDPELTREDLFGKLAGKAKEAAGSLVGNDDLARDGRLQQARLTPRPKQHVTRIKQTPTAEPERSRRRRRRRSPSRVDWLTSPRVH